MADPAPIPSKLPFFFREIVPLDSNRHADLHLDRGLDYAFARNTNAIPIALEEAGPAGGDCPLVFGAAGQTAMLAVVGYRDGENLFVDAAGHWRPGAYVPAYARNYPFAFIEAPDGKTLVLGFDPQSAAIGKTGAPFFAAAQPTKALTEAVELCRQLYHALRETASFCAALEAQGLLAEHSAVIEFKQGGSATLRGFRIIDAAKFAALDDAVFLDWRKRGWLAPIFAHLASVSRWARIVDLATGARA